MNQFKTMSNHMVNFDAKDNQSAFDGSNTSLTILNGIPVTIDTMPIPASNKKDNGIKQRWKTALFCLEHGSKPIDVWYDCQECHDESCAWADSNGFNQCVSPYISREGTDNGKWVNLNSNRWQNMEYTCDCGCMNK